MATTARKPAEETPATLTVRILDAADLIHPTEGRLARRGDLIELPAPRALALIRSGKATGLARVRTLVDHVTIGGRIHAAGDLAWIEPDLVDRYEARGLVAVVEPAPGSKASRIAAG